jgi:hypothetical protein
MDLYKWFDGLTPADEAVLDSIELSTGLTPDDDLNPVTTAIKQMTDDATLQHWLNEDGSSLAALSRLAIRCQMSLFDRHGGPEGDRHPKALRRHWYSYYKVDFAIPVSNLLGEDLNGPKWGTRWAGRMSQAYSHFVTNPNYNITYRDLWVEDGSRRIETHYDRLFKDCDILFVVEKDSLVQDFIGVSKAIGAQCLYSSKGKSSMAAIEKVLRDSFGWSEYNDPFSHDNPLYIMHVSDWDYDGEEVIGPTIGTQVRYYTPHTVEVRVGINPDQVLDQGYALRDKWYQIKLSNTAYKSWAAVKGLFSTALRSVRIGLPVTAANGDDPFEFGEGPEGAMPIRWVPHGLEVEAIKAHEYRRYVVEALLAVLPFDTIVTGLRYKCKPDTHRVAEQITAALLADNDEYTALQKEIERLSALQAEFLEGVRAEVQEVVEQTGDDIKHHLADLEDDPEEEELYTYAQEHGSSHYAQAWQPFSERVRSDHLEATVMDASYRDNPFARSEVGYW